MPGRDRLSLPVLALLMGGALVAALFVDPYRLTVVIEIAILVIFVLSLDFLVGYAGLVSFGHAGFMGVGAYALAYLSHFLGWPTGVAMLAGVLAAPIRTVEPGMDVEILIPALVVVVIGGPGSLKGAVLGAVIIGTAETFGPVIVPEFASFIMYAVMAAVLLVRPQGLIPVKPAH